MQWRVAIFTCGLYLITPFARADEKKDGSPSPGSSTPSESAPERGDEKQKNPLVRISRKDEVWIDRERKLVVVNGRVSMREGPLEMFACPKGTKEHESIVAVNSRAQMVHAGLLAVGAEPGHPVKFRPEYQPASGPRVDVIVVWHDEQGKRHQAKAQEWVRNTRTQEQLSHSWVFGGSGFWTDPDTGDQYYLAEDGDLLCLSNFSTATLDLPIKSDDANSALLFEAFTERIPPLGTKVHLVLAPREEKKEEPAGVEPKAEKPQ